MDTRPDKILGTVRIPMTAAGTPTFRDVTRCDRHRPTGLPFTPLPADTELACEICEHDE